MVVRAYDGLFYALKKLCSPVVNREEIEELDDHIMYQIMIDLENNLPITEMPFHLHSIYHLPQQVLHYGPLSDVWSFPFESKFKDMKGMAKKEGKEITLIDEARMVPAGVVRLMELQEQGYSYVRP